MRKRDVQAALIGVGLSAASVVADPTNLFVARSGSDANPGTREKPFATLERARDAIRTLKKVGPLPSGGVVVYLREGAYELRETFILTAEDAGSEAAPIVYRAHPDEKVILTGGRSITGFVPHKGEILKADVGAQGFKGIRFRQLLCNGKRQILARYPNFDPTNPHGGGYAYVDGQPLGMYEQIPGGENVRVIQSRRCDVHTWTRPELGEVIIFPRYNYNNISVPIASTDPDKGTITLAKDIADSKDPYARSIRPLDRYYVRGLPEELDSPGEWFLDADTWTLYFWPPCPIQDAIVRAPVVNDLISMGPGADWITFRGFTIEGCDGTAVNIRDSSNCLIAGNTIHDTGGKLGGSAGVSVTGGRNCGVAGNDIYGVCNDGIRLASDRADRDTLTPSGHYADNNYIHHIGVLTGHGKGIFLCDYGGVGHRISHNLIHDTNRSGIFGGYTDCVIEYNHIRHVNLETEDTAAFYTNTLGWHIRGLVIRYNYIHDILGYGRKDDTWKSPYYAWGIYLDDDSTGAHVYGNIVARTPNGGVHIHAGRDNIVENNILIDHTSRQAVFSGHTSDSHVITKHLRYFREAMAKPAYREKYPELVDADEDTIWEMAGNAFRRNIIYYQGADSKLYWCGVHDGKKFQNNTCDHNLIWHGGLPVTIGQSGMKGIPGELSWEQWQEMGFDRDSVVADPLFVDPGNGDYRLKPDSPAFKLGFEPIPVEEIGPYASPLRASWPIVEADGVREIPLVSTKVELPPRPLREVPQVVAPKVTSAPVVDGHAKPGEWPETVSEIAQSRIRSAPCELRTCHDGVNLYVSVAIPLKDASSLSLGTGWGGNDGMEVCFQDLSEPTGRPIFVIHGFAEGTHESVIDAGAPAAAARTLGAVVRFAANVEANRWIAEWSIPLQAAGITYTPGARLAFNVGVRRTETNEWLQWCASGATWKVDAAGWLVLE